MRTANKDVWCGLLFIVVGLGFGYQAFFKLQIGSLRSMGPGFLAASLSVVVICIGLAICFKGIKDGWATTMPAIPWRGVIAILAGPVVFSMMIGPFGMVPSILVLAAISTTASRKTSIVSSVATSLFMTVICVGIFIYGLGMPIPLFGPLLINP